MIGVAVPRIGVLITLPSVYPFAAVPLSVQYTFVASTAMPCGRFWADAMVVSVPPIRGTLITVPSVYEFAGVPSFVQ